MASRPPQPQERVLTEEERIEEDKLAAQAEEIRKKNMQARRIAIKKGMIEEEQRSKVSMLQMHKTWRTIMREQSVQQLRKDIDYISKNHLHEVEIKDRVIRALYQELEESEKQHQEATSRHFIMLDKMIDRHDVRKQQMEDIFQGRLEGLNHSFSNPGSMTEAQSEIKKSISAMMKLMKEGFDEELEGNWQRHGVALEIVKNKNVEDYNVLKLQCEAKIEKMERDISKTHHDYIEKTKHMEEEFKIVQARDRITSRTIEKQMHDLISFHGQTAYMRTALITKGKEWNTTNKQIFDERRRLNNHFMKLQHAFSKYALVEHHNLKKTSMSVHEATVTLKKFLVFVRKLQILARRNQTLETEHEQIFPFNPLYTGSIPTVFLEGIDEELAAANEKCHIHGNQPKAGWEVADDVVSGEPVPGQVVPKQEQRFQLDMRLSFPTDVGANAAPPLPTPTFHWASYAVDDNGNEISEYDYFQNFQKHYNKVMLDKLALQLEKRKLTAENRELQDAMAKWLDGHSLTSKAKAKENSLMGVERYKMKPPPPRKSTVRIKPPKRKPPPGED